MIAAFDVVAFDRGTDAVLQFFTIEHARALVAYRGDETIRARMEELAEKSNEGDLSDQERAEYEGYIQANDFIATLQAKARKLLAGT